MIDHSPWWITLLFLGVPRHRDYYQLVLQMYIPASMITGLVGCTSFYFFHLYDATGTRYLLGLLVIVGFLLVSLGGGAALTLLATHAICWMDQNKRW